MSKRDVLIVGVIDYLTCLLDGVDNEVYLVF